MKSPGVSVSRVLVGGLLTRLSWFCVFMKGREREEETQGAGALSYLPPSFLSKNVVYIPRDADLRLSCECVRRRCRLSAESELNAFVVFFCFFFQRSIQSDGVAFRWVKCRNLCPSSREENKTSGEKHKMYSQHGSLFKIILIRIRMPRKKKATTKHREKINKIISHSTIHLVKLRNENQFFFTF